MLLDPESAGARATIYVLPVFLKICNKKVTETLFAGHHGRTRGNGTLVFI
jgi:hypothetical protein